VPLADIGRRVELPGELPLVALAEVDAGLASDEDEHDGGNEGFDAGAVAAGGAGPSTGGGAGAVEDEEVEQGRRPRDDECDGQEEQVGGVDLYGDVEAEVIEDDVGGEEGGEQGAEQAGAAEEDEDACGDFGGATDHLVDRVEADEGPEHGHGRGVAQGLVEDREGGRTHLQGEELGQAVADHGVAESEADDETEPEEEAWVGGGVVGAELIGGRPDEGGEEGHNGHDAEGDPVHDGVAGAGAVEFGSDAGEVEQVLAETLGGVEEGPGGPVFKVLADVEGDALPEGGVAAAEGVDEEVAEAEAEG